MITSFWTATYVVNDASLAGGYTKDIGKGSRMKINIGKEVHYVGIVELTETEAVVNVSSESQQKRMSIGEEWKVELTNDSYYDLSVKLDSISNNKANMTIIKIDEKIPVIEQLVPEENIKEQYNKEIEFVWIWITIIAVCIVLFIIYYFKINKQRKN